MALKRTEKYLLGCVAVGAISALIVAWLWPGAAWWLYAILGLVVSAGLYRALLDQASKETIIDNLKR